MTSRQLYDGVLIELNKENAPNILLEDFNYFANKAINNYINKRYNIYDVNQQTTDDLRVLKATALLPVNPVTDYNGMTMAGDGHMATYETVLPSDYLHLLNCICIYKVKKTYKCYNKDDYWRCAATRLTADMYSQVLDNFWNKPTYKRPYYYIHNVNVSNFVPTNPYGYKTFKQRNINTNSNTDSNSQTDHQNDGWYFSDNVLYRISNNKLYYFYRRQGGEVEVLSYENQIIDYKFTEEVSIIENAIGCESYFDGNSPSGVEGKDHKIRLGNPFNETILTDQIRLSQLNLENIPSSNSSSEPDESSDLLLGVDSNSVSKKNDDKNRYSLNTDYESDAFGSQIIQGKGLPRTISIRKQDGGIEKVSNIERGQALRYGNVSEVRLEIRYGTDNQVFELEKVYVDYIKAPQNIRLTQQELDLTEDTSQMLEYPDYVCQEIINELVHLVMENISDQRLQTHPVVTQSIANPAQAQAPQAQGKSA